MLEQSIRYPAKSSQDAFLLELPAGFMDCTELYLKGNELESTTLTTSSATFRLREASTSNVIHIVSISDAIEEEVILNSSIYFELEKIVPSLESLKELLASNTFPKIPDIEVPHSLHMQNVFTEFQASDTEIEGLLKREKASVISGIYRKFDPEYLMRFFEIMQANATLQDLDIVTCTFEQLCSLVSDHEDEFPSEISRLIIDSYSLDGRLVPSDIVRLFGGELLKAKNVWTEHELMSSLNKLVGDLNITIDMLAVCL